MNNFSIENNLLGAEINQVLCWKCKQQIKLVSYDYKLSDALNFTSKGYHAINCTSKGSHAINCTSKCL